MDTFRLETPVAFIVFNRPDTTGRVFAEIAKAKPPLLLVIADGPRKGRPEEERNCALTREIVKKVDWPCEVVTNFSEVNLGCRSRVSSGIDWVFEQVPEAIILEDDCLPHPTFFRFCQEMLVKYRDDERIGMISGDNFQHGTRFGDASYYFSKYVHIWGWASWRRAWRHYDVSMKNWPAFLSSGGIELKTLPCEQGTWFKALERVFRGEIDTWDYQWVFACWSQSMLSVIPQGNLISNIGFGENATHTKSNSPLASLPIEKFTWPVVHPKVIGQNYWADKRSAEMMFSGGLRQRVEARIRRTLGG